MGINKFTGSPWHVENVHRAEGDDRRYKGRCKYYKYNNMCKYRMTKCIGSAHCTSYTALSEEEFKKKQKKQKIKYNQKASQTMTMFIGTIDWW